MSLRQKSTPVARGEGHVVKELRAKHARNSAQKKSEQAGGATSESMCQGEGAGHRFGDESNEFNGMLMLDEQLLESLAATSWTGACNDDDRRAGEKDLQRASSTLEADISARSSISSKDRTQCGNHCR